MKLSNACLLGLFGSILFLLNTIINFISLYSSEYYKATTFSTLLWISNIVGWLLIVVFFIVFFGKCKKIDRIHGDADF